MTERPMPHVEGVEHQFVDVDGVRIHVAVCGPEDGPAVVLQHGWPQHWYSWRRVMPLLAAQGFRVHAPDLRGLGWSDAPATSYRKTEFAADIAGLLDALDLRDVRLAGHDWGGYATFLVALNHPQRLRSLTQFSIISPWSRGIPTPLGVLAVLGYQPLMATPKLGPAVLRHAHFADLLYRISGGRRVWSAEEQKALTDQFQEPARCEASSRIYRSFLLREFVAKAPPGRVSVPMTLTIGKKDPVVSKLLARGTGSRADAGYALDVVPGGHFLPEECPELVAAKIAAA